MQRTSRKTSVEHSESRRVVAGRADACAREKRADVPVKRFRVGRVKARLRFGVTLLCLVTVALVAACNGGSKKLTFALPVADWWTAAPFIVSQSGPAFKARGLELSTLEVKSGLESKNAVVAGTADVGLSAATPLALAAAKKEGLVILGTYLRSSAVVGIVRPKDMKPGDIPPQPIAVVPSTISESYLYQYMKQIGQNGLMEQKKLQELSLRPADVPGALKSGSAKSAVIWEPFLSLGKEQRDGLEADPNAVSFEVNLYLITRPSVLRDHPDEIKAFLAAVGDTCQYMMEKKTTDEARHQVERRFDFHPDFLATPWPAVQYGLKYERKNMEDEINREAQTAKALGSISEIPDVGYMLPAGPPQ